MELGLGIPMILYHLPGVVKVYGQNIFPLFWGHYQIDAPHGVFPVDFDTNSNILVTDEVDKSAIVLIADKLTVCE